MEKLKQKLLFDIGVWQEHTGQDIFMG